MTRLRTMLFAIISMIGLNACDRTEITYMVGTLERDRIELKVESSEPIIAIHARDGQAVAAGDLVLEQDPERADARLAQQLGWQPSWAFRWIQRSASRAKSLSPGQRWTTI